MKEQQTIKSFRGDYRFLSNFHPCEVEFEDIVYCTVEHAYQAAKTLDAKERKTIFSAITAGIAKRRGQKLTLRKDWEEIKLDVMYELVFAKFAESAGLQVKLFDTGDAELVEGNYWNDTFWGVCKGVGENHLGKILMRVRKELLEELGSESQP